MIHPDPKNPVSAAGSRTSRTKTPMATPGSGAAIG